MPHILIIQRRFILHHRLPLQIKRRKQIHTAVNPTLDHQVRGGHLREQQMTRVHFLQDGVGGSWRVGAQVAAFLGFHVVEVLVLGETDVVLGHQFEGRAQTAHDAAQLLEHRDVLAAVS